MLPNTHFKNLRTFVPAKDYELSRKFYQKLGFVETGFDEDMATYKIGDFEFILQNYYVKDWANNFMLVLKWMM